MLHQTTRDSLSSVELPLRLCFGWFLLGGLHRKVMKTRGQTQFSKGALVRVVISPIKAGDIGNECNASDGSRSSDSQ